MALAAWAAGAAWLAVGAGADLDTARGELRTLRDDADVSTLLDDEGAGRLAVIEARLARAERRFSSPVLAPVRVLPVLGRQLRSASALTAAAAQATTTAAAALDDVGAVLDDARSPDTDRVAMLRRVNHIARGASAELAAVDLGPDEALVGPLADARLEMVHELDEVRALLRTVEHTTSALAEVVAGPACHLLLAANNAEMRAGSGMFLQAGELCFDDGEISLGELQETSDLVLPADAVDIADPDLRDRWGHLLPNAEWRNLALTPRFDATAALARDMWREATGREVAGVMAVDPAVLAVLLEATGPIVVDGVRYDGDDVVEHLLIEQYEGFLDPDYDAEARRDRLGEVAAAAVDAFDAGGWDLETLVDDLPEAAAGRHILAWSPDERIQRGWEAMGVAGTLEPDSLAVSVLNRGGGRGGGKLDALLRVRSRLDVEEHEDGALVRLDVELHNPVEPGTPTYAENPDDPDVRFGVYQGILAVNVPGGAGELRLVRRGGQAVELAARGDDGPTRVIATPVELGPGGRRTYTVEFRLPPGTRSLRIEPSARIPAIEWRAPGAGSFEDVLGRTASW